MSLEKNLLIEAGAGTGKTTRLIKAILQALFVRQIAFEKIVALTFTNKAAGELKDRVGDALEDVLEATSIDTLRQKPWWPSPEIFLSLSDLQALAASAIAVLDRANVSTIHSYAFALLKRYPLAAGIDPEASIDDKKLRFDEFFRREWPLWLSVELGEKAPREEPWLELLSKLTLSDLESAARRLADFEVPLEKLRLPDAGLPERLTTWHASARALSAAHGGDFNADRVAQACEEIIGAGAQDAWEKLETLSPETGEALALTPGKPKAWPEEDLRQLKMLQTIAENLLARGDRILALATELLKPFVKHFRQTLLAEGCLTHSALLYLSREIVKNDTTIRNALKRDIGLILIDEFQDTDPLQAELLLYLAEKAGDCANSWETVRLEPGKLFIVGDPKQSIYRFRGADIAAYERIGKLLIEQGGFRETLEVNYRSQEQIIHVVNQAFERIIQPVPGISPPYVAVKPHHRRDTAHLVQNVEIWLAESPKPQSVEEAQATEAEHIARWINESRDQLTVYDPREGQRRPMLYRDVALIFRTYSPMDRYIEALRRHDIPFAVESERYFFTTPEVTDFINLLRAADAPEDILSLVGFLRGPLGGLSDEEILRRKNAGTLEETAPVRWLRALTERLRRRPLAHVLQDIFENTFLMELAARSYHGDQTVANLLKLRRLLEEFASKGVTTMGLLLEKLEEFFGDDKIEGESPLADENYNAVRLLTIHKAKGLEYPVVFLPSLHSELRPHPPDSLAFDWRRQTLGLTLAGVSNLDKLELDEQNRRREEAEENRILYVAMTRARERLVLSGGVNLKSNRSRNYLMRFLAACELSLDGLAQGEIALGQTSLSVRRLNRVEIPEETARLAAENPLLRVDPETFKTIWADREKRCEITRQTPIIVTPTSGVRGTLYVIRDDDDAVDSSPTYHVSRTASALLGTLIHRFLEQWDFTCEKCSMPLKLRQVANSYFSSEGLLKEPFPDPKECEKSNNPAELVEVVVEAQRLLADFIGSEAWEEIKGSTILGREVPFFYSMPDFSPITDHVSSITPLMRGTMDILYRLPDGKLIIGDYKTGKTEQDYSAQRKAYLDAVKKSLGEDAVFKVINLREEAIIN